MHNAYSDALDTMLRDCCTPAVIRAIERAEDHLPLWHHCQDSGFADCLLPEAAGGAGLALDELAPVLFALGRHALPLPLGQTIFARVLLHALGWRCRPSPSRWQASTWKKAPRMRSWSRRRASAWFLVQEGTQCVLLHAPARSPPDLASMRIWPWSCLALPGWTAFVHAARSTLRQIGACLHAAQLAGAMSHVFDMTLRYANDRQQFGRAIASSRQSSTRSA